MELLIYFYQQFQFFLHSRSSSYLMQARFNFSHYKELTQARQQAHMLHLQEADHLVAKTTVSSYCKKYKVQANRLTILEELPY